MKHTMKKFSRGGAQGMYDRRMADIEKDFKKNSAGKSGKALEVLEAKRMQRTADAEDDRAKRTGGDRTATRAAERLAEVNLTKTRKYGAPKSVTKDELIAPGKMAESIGPITLPKMDSSIGAKPAAKPVQKPVQKPAAKPARMGDQGFAYKKKDMATTGDGVSTHSRYVRGGSNSGAAADGTAAQRLKNKGLETEGLKTGNKGTGTNRLAAAADPKDNSSAASRARAGAALSYLNPFSYISDETSARYAKEQKAKGYTKGGKIKKMAKGGSTPPQPTPADRARSKKQLDELKKIKVTPENAAAIGRGNRSESSPASIVKKYSGDKQKVADAVRSGQIGMKKGGKIKKYAAGGVTKEMPSSKAMGSMGMAKGGKAKAKGKGKGNPFAATKFGAAMMKKGADAKGRAMMKFAKGGSIDGCAVRGKTKAKRVTMARGGMTGYKKGGKTC